jgi:alpha-L-fucosidase
MKSYKFFLWAALIWIGFQQTECFSGELVRYGQVGKIEKNMMPDQWISFSGLWSDGATKGELPRGLNHQEAGASMSHEGLAITAHSIRPEYTRLQSNRAGSLLGIVGGASNDQIDAGEAVSFSFNQDVIVKYIQTHGLGSVGVEGTKGSVRVGETSFPFTLTAPTKIKTDQFLPKGELLTLSTTGSVGGWSPKAILVETEGKTPGSLGPTATVSGHFTVSPDELSEKMTAQWDRMIARPIPEWLRDAKFGIYAHWGLYSVGHHCSEWYARHLYNPEYQAGRAGRLINDFEANVGTLKEGYGYKDMAQFLTAENYDPDFWASVVEESGAKFAGFSISHCDGFGMWASDVYDWNVGKVGPKRDLYGEFVSALRKTDVKIITTSHMKRTHGWMLPPPKFRQQARDEKWDVMNPEYKGIYPSNETGVTPDEYEQHWSRCLHEVVHKYRPDVIWFDGGSFKTPRATDFVEYYFKQADERGQSVHVINKRPVSGPGMAKTYNFPDAFGMKDFEHGRDRPADYEDEFFDSLTITGGSWGYAWINGEQSIGVEKLSMYLIDSVSRGGSILLSLAPTSDGILPEATIKTLRDLGAWLRVNGEAIYATRKWDYPSDEDADVETEKYVYANPAHINRWHFDKFTNDDVRYTRSKDGKYVYVMTLGQPSGSSVVAKRFAKGQPFKIKSISLLGSDKKLHCEQTAEGLIMHLPSSLPTHGALAFKLRVESLERLAIHE